MGELHHLFGGKTPDQQIMDENRAKNVLAGVLINACAMCDDMGYRPNGYVCDHVDHRPAYERGMQMVSEVLHRVRGG